MLDLRRASPPCLCVGCVLHRSGAVKAGSAPRGGAANDAAGATSGAQSDEARYSGTRDDGTGMPPLHHIGMVVRDYERTLANLGGALGFGPAHRFDFVDPTAVLANGETGLALKGAFVWMRNTALEIVEPVDDRSPHAHFLKERGEGLHHLAYWVNSVRGEIETMSRNGVPPRILVDGTAEGNPVPWCYLEGDMAGSAIIELIERNQGSEQVYAEIFAAIGGKVPV